MPDDPLDPQTSHPVIVEDPPGFEQLLRDWEKNGHTWYVPVTERTYQGDPGDEHAGADRTPEQRMEFARWVRDLEHQADLEQASVPPVISIQLAPPSQADSRPPGRHRGDSGAIHVTRRAHDMITAPQRAVTGPMPAIGPRFEETEIMDVVVGDAPEDPADPGRA